MDCKTALAIIGEWGRSQIWGQELKGVSGDAEEAFAHIRECREKKCSLVRDDFDRAIKTAIGFGEGLKLTFKY